MVRLFDRLFAWYSPTYRWWHTSMLSSEDNDFRFDHYLSYWRSGVSRHSCTTYSKDCLYDSIQIIMTPQLLPLLWKVCKVQFILIDISYLCYLYFFILSSASHGPLDGLMDHWKMILNHTSNTNRLQVPHFGTSTNMLHLWAHWVTVWCLMQHTNGCS